MTVERADPQMASDEPTMLTEFLDWYRETLLVKVDGLTDEEARRPAAPPSSLNLMGLVRHMAEVERAWFRRRFVGEAIGPQFYTDADPDLDLHPPPDATLAEAIDAWTAEVALARTIAGAARPDDIAAKPARDGKPINMRWIMVHMIEEYARHCGHADLLREAIDGQTGD